MILSNQIECLRCGDRPYSAHVHDFKYCKCGAIAVDGGMFYFRRVGADLSAYKDISIEISDEDCAALKDVIKNAIDTGRNPLGVLCAVAIVCRDRGIDLRGENEPVQ